MKQSDQADRPNVCFNQALTSRVPRGQLGTTQSGLLVAVEATATTVVAKSLQPFDGALLVSTLRTLRPLVECLTSVTAGTDAEPAWASAFVMGTSS
jgi:hypothetical protein